MNKLFQTHDDVVFMKRMYNLLELNFGFVTSWPCAISCRLILGLLVPSMAQAQSVTFHADVAPIIYTHCTECHRVGEIGPCP